MGYQRKKRANKYDEKLKIDASFEDAIKALMGVPNQNQNTMIVAFKEFNFFSKQNDQEVLRKQFSIKIPEMLVSEIEIKIELLSEHTKATFNVIAEKGIKNHSTESISYSQLNRVFLFQKDIDTPIQSELVESFDTSAFDFKADCILIDLFDCDSDKAKIKASVIRKYK